MESKKAKCSSKHPHRIKPKGDRLGWTLRSAVKHPPLREIIGEGKIVSTLAASFQPIQKELCNKARHYIWLFLCMTSPSVSTVQSSP